MLIVSDNSRNIYVVDIYIESTWQNVILLWQLWHLWLRQHNSYQLWVQMSPLPYCLLINTLHHTVAHPHRCDGPWNRPVIQSLSVNIATETGKKRYWEDQQISTYINLIHGLWMDVSSVTSVYQPPCCRLHSPHPTFRILRGHSQGSAHCAPVTIMSSPGSWCCYSVESFTALQLTVQQLNSMLLSFHRQFWYFPMV